MVSLKSISLILVFILVVHIFATINYWYWTYRWLDIPMHFLGGVLLAMVFFYLIKPNIQINNHKIIITIISCLAFVALGGVFWEFFEFVYDFFIAKKIYFGPHPLLFEKRLDVIKDLFFDLVGGLALAVWAVLKSKSDKEPSLSENKQNRNFHHSRS